MKIKYFILQLTLAVLFFLISLSCYFGFIVQHIQNTDLKHFGMLLFAGIGMFTGLLLGDLIGYFKGT